jgi:hypothetical protein
MFLLIIARWIRSFLFPFGFIYSTIYLVLVKRELKLYRRYLVRIAIGEDQLANVYSQHLFGHTMIKRQGYQFGHEDETISSVLGKNKMTGTLSPIGTTLANFLNMLEKDHVEKAIEQNP